MAVRNQSAVILFPLFALVMPAYGQHTSLRFSTADGGQIEYVVSGDPNSTETVVFIHGVGLADAFSLVADEPPLEDYRLIRMHRRGYAGSSNAIAPFTMADQAADVIALLDALEIESAHLVGHSYGGAVALQAAATAPKRIDSLVLVESAPPPGMLSSPPPIEVAGAEAGRLLQAGDAAGAVEVFFKGVFGND
jgi:pimeloyl-ACP methyl ester carboxylesterase